LNSLLHIGKKTRHLTFCAVKQNTACITDEHTKEKRVIQFLFCYPQTENICIFQYYFNNGGINDRTMVAHQQILTGGGKPFRVFCTDTDIQCV